MAAVFPTPLPPPNTVIYGTAYLYGMNARSCPKFGMKPIAGCDRSNSLRRCVITSYFLSPESILD